MRCCCSRRDTLGAQRTAMGDDDSGSFPVTLRVYDLSLGMAKTMSMQVWTRTCGGALMPAMWPAQVRAPAACAHPDPPSVCARARSSRASSST